MNKVMKTFNSDNLISLWILCDEYGRIYYTGYDRGMAEGYLKDSLYKNLQIVELIGSYEKTNSGKET